MVSKMVQFYKKFRVWIVYFVMGLIVVAPYLESAFHVTELRLTILTACPLLMVFLLNDWVTEVIGRLAKLEESIKNPDPPMFKDFPKVEDRLDALLGELIAEGKPIRIDVLGVSAKYTWQYFQRVISGVLANPPKDLDLAVRIAVTCPSKLDEWELRGWSKACRYNLDFFKEYSADHCKTLARAGIRVAMFEYDNLPHWHGVIINDSILFQGRTEWFRDRDEKGWDLRVGEVEYREFHLDDHYGGKTRIARFVQWFNRYLARAQEKHWFYSWGFEGETSDEEMTSKPTREVASPTPK